MIELKREMNKTGDLYNVKAAMSAWDMAAIEVALEKVLNDGSNDIDTDYGRKLLAKLNKTYDMTIVFSEKVEES